MFDLEAKDIFHTSDAFFFFKLSFCSSQGLSHEVQMTVANNSFKLIVMPDNFLSSV